MRSARRVFLFVFVVANSGLFAGCSTAPSPSANPVPSNQRSILPDPATAGVTSTLVRIAEMGIPRAVQSSTRLADGRILIAGGCTNIGCDVGSVDGATAELYDPRTQTFRQTGVMTISRDDHAAVLLPDGRVLLAGGWTADGVTNTTELYDPLTGMFRAGPDMSSPRAGITPIALGDGRILLTGGFTDNRPTIASADLFDPTTDMIAATGPMTAARGAYAATRLLDGRVLVAGGLSDGTVVASAEVFDPVTGSFDRVGSMATARYKAGSVTLLDGRPFVIGGSGDIDGQTLFRSTETFDPATATFAVGAAMERARYKLVNSVVLLDDGRVLVAGGADRPEVYEPTAAAFTSVDGSLDTTRLFLTATAIDGQRVLLVGGYDDRISPTAAAWVVQ